MIALYDDAARRSGARIVPMCGHDCVPWDLLAFDLASALAARSEETVAYDYLPLLFFLSLFVLPKVSSWIEVEKSPFFVSQKNLSIVMIFFNAPGDEEYKSLPLSLCPSFVVPLSLPFLSSLFAAGCASMMRREGLQAAVRWRPSA